MKKIIEFKISEKLSTYLFYASVLFFLIAFNFQDSKTGGWYQQNMPALGGRTISDITFTDSLSGYATAQTSSDSNYILKTSNGGDNWSIVYKIYRYLTRVQFINNNVGFVGGSILLKTTNAGLNWNEVPTLFDPKPYEIFVFNQDTIWYSDTDPLVGGLFRTTNGGTSWQRLSDGIIQPYPDKLYFYNSRIGFASGYNGSRLFRTTNSGINWVSIPGINGFIDIVFVDSLTGYKKFGSISKTTDGGTNWNIQILPNLNYNNSFYKFAMINRDTIYGVGGSILTSLGIRGIVYKTINGGQNWGYQIPDTININATSYYFGQFINKNIGWAHHTGYKGIHTTVGGNDTTFYTGINNNITSVSKEFILYQNYPNPFNPKTVIGYSLLKNSFVKIIVFDILGKEVATLVNGNKKAGKYETQFSINQYTINGNSSGIYFYTLFVDGNRIDTKKMALIK